jgi:lipopolysaccharide heptosyltransferase I
MLPLDQLTPRRICLIKPSALGDVVQTLPILSMLRTRWPGAHIGWLVNRSLAGILEGHPELDEVILFDRGAKWWRRPRVAWDLYRRLRREQFDLAIDLQGLFRSGAMAWASGAPRRVGFADAREGASRMYTDCVAVTAGPLPALERYRHIAAALGCRGEPPQARLGIGATHREWAASYLAQLPRPLLTIHPGAQWATKRWLPQHFAEVARRWQAESDGGIVLVGGPGEGSLCRQIAAQLAGTVVNLAERTSLLQLAAVAEMADLFLSGDTGPMHLAAAVGTPVVSVFTCTSPLRAGPRDNESRIVATQVPCAASYLKRCSAMICMRELTPDRVWPVVQNAFPIRQPQR